MEQTEDAARAICYTELYNFFCNGGRTIVVADLRSEEEYEKGHLSGSWHLPFDTTSATREAEDGDQILPGMVACIEPLHGMGRAGRYFKKLVVIDGDNKTEEEKSKRALRLADLIRDSGWLSNSFSVYIMQDTFAGFLADYRYLLRTGKRNQQEAPGTWPSQLLPNFLYLSGVSSARNREVLRNLGITHIINISSEKNFFINDKAMNYLNIKIEDEVDVRIRSHFEVAHAFLDSAKEESKLVLVHCQAGVSRSTTVVLSYLMKRNGWSLKESFDFVKERREVISPNPGFMEQLCEYEMELFNACTMPEYANNSKS